MKKRAIYLRVDQVRRLDHWCESLARSFERTPYLVGSVLSTPEWRDVDIRMAFRDMERCPMDLADLNMLVSKWGQDQTFLPIDFQLQPKAEFRKFDQEIRNPRGIVRSSRPSEGEDAES